MPPLHHWYGKQNTHYSHLRDQCCHEDPPLCADREAEPLQSASRVGSVTGRSLLAGHRWSVLSLDATGSPAPSPVRFSKNFTSSYTTPTHPISLVKVTLNSLCSTHKHNSTSFFSTLYMVGSLFVLPMWDISLFYFSLLLANFIPT